jgi:rubrerythrin
MKSIRGTETEKNLLKSFAGESQARNRYDMYASAARKEGFEQIAAVFAETAEQERQHAKRFFSHLEGGDVEITAAFPAGGVGTTLENLRAAAGGEHHEWAELYPRFAGVAREEGFEVVARQFETVMVAERQHENRYRQFAARVAAGQVFRREAPVRWRCRNCGYVHEGTEAPGACPACAHPQAFFEVLVDAG